ncbi:hypothetical protein [Hoeflea ulvae]|uniref:Uncharacterized protein n=1 Tax=Hoeflea ulvae TaxID=2983764 RepID=A0ABT3YCF9_9HYPH|nr:hypothetical protein [Hoeflea ulvae]MCY0093578.1 hypothetical protein [Hoeflea ulvae]
MTMTRMDEDGQPEAARAFRGNRMAAIGMTLAAAATLLLLRPELALVYVVHMAISVYALSLTRRHGLLGKACPLQQQNLAAYVSVSTIGFLLSLYAAPEMFDHIGSIIFIVIAAVMAVLVLYAIWDRK